LADLLHMALIYPNVIFSLLISLSVSSSFSILAFFSLILRFQVITILFHLINYQSFKFFLYLIELSWFHPISYTKLWMWWLELLQ
jgi:hypothetical protein